MAERLPFQYVSAEQQRQAAMLGMWIFLGTELMLFGGLFLGYIVYRLAYPEAWQTGSGKLDFALATANTAILLTSSLCMALADHALAHRRQRLTLTMLGLTALLGIVFLGIKLYEYSAELHENLVPLPWLTFGYQGSQAEAVQLFFNFYFTMTGIHFVHLFIGIVLVLTQLVHVARWKDPARLTRRVLITGLYWHFVDLLWVFLYPLLYMVSS